MVIVDISFPVCVFDLSFISNCWRISTNLQHSMEWNVLSTNKFYRAAIHLCCQDVSRWIHVKDIIWLTTGFIYWTGFLYKLLVLLYNLYEEHFLFLNHLFLDTCISQYELNCIIYIEFLFRSTVVNAWQ